uniref:Uncharacterized protein n=1 Tax=Trypanosoma congolense (strain IL3000) TaxID=1068625 RepID=G0URK2_TRYCI|nr:conserved hypothetical protein [Trypanosoma congolense IL3000]
MVGHHAEAGTSPIGTAEGSGYAAEETIGGACDASTSLSSDQLRLITRRMSRALLRAPQEEVGDRTRQLYETLHDLFVRWSERQQRASFIGLSPEQVGSLLRYGADAIRQASIAGLLLSKAQRAVELVSASPLLTIEAINRELRDLQHPVSLRPIAEVLELARVLDDAQGLRTPIGMINLVHFVALSSTLCPVEDMRALLLLVASNTGNNHLLCSAIYHEWAILDKQNSSQLLLLSKLLESEYQKARHRPTDVVVAELLDGEFESLGCCPIDPAVADCVGNGGAPRPPLNDAVSCSSGGDGSPGGENCTSPVVSGDVSEDYGDTVDTEFWSRLCS